MAEVYLYLVHDSKWMSILSLLYMGIVKYQVYLEDCRSRIVWSQVASKKLACYQCNTSFTLSLRIIFNLFFPTLSHGCFSETPFVSPHSLPYPQDCVEIQRESPGSIHDSKWEKRDWRWFLVYGAWIRLVNVLWINDPNLPDYTC